MADKLTTYISEQQIQQAVCRIAKEIEADYKNKPDSNLLLVGILKGSTVFMTDLMRKIDMPLAIDFMSVSSYGKGTASTGNVKINMDLNINASDYDIIIVEDILDSGYTLSKLIQLLNTRKPKSLKVCTLLDKPERRKAEVRLDYCGMRIEDKFIVGYGLDYGERYRNLPYIAIIEPDTNK
jgi:hypoxanthine phosphoribosyltransferase